MQEDVSKSRESILKQQEQGKQPGKYHAEKKSVDLLFWANNIEIAAHILDDLS